jgi:oxaloacetate decarboxylase alpha subunit
MKRYRITLEGQTFDVRVLDDPRSEKGQVRVEVNGETFTVGVESVPVVAEITTGEAAPAIAPSPVMLPPTPGDMTTAGNAVTAPLPGVIKSIAIRPGQQVAPNDELLVIEAMKMDNVIRAIRAGAIGTIHVTEGRQVAYGELMLDFAD